jgi:hypothetical protein
MKKFNFGKTVAEALASKKTKTNKKMKAFYVVQEKHENGVSEIKV